MVFLYICKVTVYKTILNIKMRKCILWAFGMATMLVSCHKETRYVEIISSTMEHPWQRVLDMEVPKFDLELTMGVGDSTLVIDPLAFQQTIEGFGACFNELGWTSLSVLSQSDRDSIFRELYAPGVGANFTMNRMPLGSNDFSLDYYSYDDMDGDFDLAHFSIEHDEATLLPFIRAAKAQNPDLRIWASPWCPPAWMKTNKHYACVSTEMLRGRFDAENGLSIDKQIHEGEDGFTQDPKYLGTYARYFGKFIDAYKEKGVDVYMVMPQNEPNSAQWYPACTWTPQGLNAFMKYLGPEMEKRGVKMFLGTMERADASMWDVILSDAETAPYIKGMGFQWAGKDAIPSLHQKYSDLPVYQSEQECGNGRNDLAGAFHSWDLMKYYLNNGTNAYFYWNISLLEGGVSHWGWRQNSLVTVNEAEKTFSFTPEYYVMKHVSHYVLPGAKVLKLGGDCKNALAFLNTNGSLVVVLGNQTDHPYTLNLQFGEHTYEIHLAAQSLSTLNIR
jgi:glucosylceramidase